MPSLHPVGRFDAFRALSERHGRAGERLLESLARARAGTGDGPATWAPAVAADLGLPAAAALGPAAYYADLVAPHGSRHVRVCTATACFAAQAGRQLTRVEQELGVTVGTLSPGGETSLQAVRCLGYCYAGPAALDGATPCTGPALAARLAGREPTSAPQMPVADDTGDPVLLAGVVAGEPAWQVWPGIVTAGGADQVHGEVAASGLRGRGGAGCPTPTAALAECGRVAPVFAGLSHDRLDREGAVPWPCPDPARPGEAKLHRDRFATADGRAHLAAAPYLPPGEHPDDDYPLVLVTGRRWAHYNSGSMTRRGANLALDPVDFLDLHPGDAHRYAVRDGEPVTVESRHGRARLIARVGEQTAPGQAFCSFHFPASGVNRLASGHVDTVTSCPEYKVTAVRVVVS